MDGRANPLMDGKVVRVVLLECLQWLQSSFHPQLLTVVCCSAAVVVVVASGAVVVEGSLEVKLPTIWTVEKQR